MAPVLPEDGIAGQPEERFTADLAGAAAGDVVLAPVRDRCDNLRTASSRLDRGGLPDAAGADAHGGIL